MIIKMKKRYLVFNMNNHKQQVDEDHLNGVTVVCSSNLLSLQTGAQVCFFLSVTDT